MADSGLSKFNQHLRINFKKGLKKIFFFLFFYLIFIKTYNLGASGMRSL